MTIGDWLLCHVRCVNNLPILIIINDTSLCVVVIEVLPALSKRTASIKTRGFEEMYFIVVHCGCRPLPTEATGGLWMQWTFYSWYDDDDDIVFMLLSQLAYRSWLKLIEKAIYKNQRFRQHTKANYYALDLYIHTLFFPRTTQNALPNTKYWILYAANWIP